MKDDDIKELAMKLYYEEGSALGEDIDHNVFECIFEEGYKSSFKEIAKIQNENVELKEELGGMMALNVKADKEIAELQTENVELKEELKIAEEISSNCFVWIEGLRDSLVESLYKNNATYTHIEIQTKSINEALEAYKYRMSKLKENTK